MVRILVTDGMDQSALEEIKSLGCDVINEHYEKRELKEAVKTVDAILVRSATKLSKEIIDSAIEGGRLKLVVRGGVGLDSIDVDYAEAKGIEVRNTPRASSRSVAELALGHMFSLARNIGISNVTMRGGEWNKKKYKGVELYGKTLGLIGFGRISRELAKKAKALGMKVLYTNRRGPLEDAKGCMYREMDDLLRQSDFISIHIPFDKKNGPLIAGAEFEKIKEGAFLVNTSRGGLVDEKELLYALDSGRISGAALDVYENEPGYNIKLASHPKVSCTPHIGAYTWEAQRRVGEEVVLELDKFFNLRSRLY